MDEPELISIRECARRIGVSDTAIHKAIKAGRVKIASRHPTNNRPLLIFDEVVASWRENTDPALQRTSPSGAKGSVRAGSPIIVGGDVEPKPVAPKKQTDTVDDEPIKPYNDSRAIKEHYAAQAAKLNYEKEAGELVSVEQVKAEAFRLARAVRDAIMQVPDRLDAQLAAMNNAREINLLLKTEMAKALSALENEQ